jgi:hypothetical protein
VSSKVPTSLRVDAKMARSPGIKKPEVRKKPEVDKPEMEKLEAEKPVKKKRNHHNRSARKSKPSLGPENN